MTVESRVNDKETSSFKAKKKRELTEEYDSFIDVDFPNNDYSIRMNKTNENSQIFED